MTNNTTNLTDREQQILTHTMMWGSDGYGAFVVKIGRAWHVTTFPVVFKTKRAATAAFESYLRALRDKKAGRI